MSLGKFTAKIAGAAMAAALMAGAPGAAQAGVVVKSTGPSASQYPVGKEVPDRSTITLRAGDRITVLTDEGTRVMSGPGTFRVGQGATRTRTRFSGLTRRGAARARTGAVRGGATDTPLSPSLWFINVAAAGPVCAYDFNRLRLWRADTSVAQNFTLTDNANNTSLAVPFVEEESVRGVDQESIPLTFGGEYTITGHPAEGKEGSSVTITFVQLDQEYETADQLALALMDKGCTSQFNLLADSMEQAAEM